MSTLRGYKLLIVILSIVKPFSAVLNFKHKARINYKFKQEHVFDEISVKSLAYCLIYCSMQQDCISASFRSPTEKCLLSSYDTIDDSGSGPGIPGGLTFAEGWTTVTKIRYPVFHAVGQYDVYSMTFEQAKQQCIDYGTTVASPSDLLQSRSMGYGMCVCSWLSDGTKGYVMQSSVSGCGYSESIIYCGGSRANVFCKLK